MPRLGNLRGVEVVVARESANGLSEETFLYANGAREVHRSILLVCCALISFVRLDKK